MLQVDMWSVIDLNEQLNAKILIFWFELKLMNNNDFSHFCQLIQKILLFKNTLLPLFTYFLNAISVLYFHLFFLYNTRISVFYDNRLCRIFNILYYYKQLIMTFDNLRKKVYWRYWNGNRCYKYLLFFFCRCIISFKLKI